MEFSEEPVETPQLAALAATARLAAVATLAGVALLAGTDQCAQCHPEAVREYLRSGMGRSITEPGADHPTGVYGHGISGTTFRTSVSDDGLVQEIERDGLSARYTVDYVIGSGNAAFGYLVRVGDALFQSPVTYYTERGRWGMAPGMEGDASPDFERPAIPECLWCHAGAPKPVPTTVNRYREPALEPAAISCDRCHGPAERHLSEPAAATIFNPAQAAPRVRDSVCEQCHLGGVIRVLHPGRDFGDFHPGRRTEEFWTVFVGRSAAPGSERFQVVSHVEQLALSRCAEASGDKFWCGTCHNPHKAPANPKADYSRRCLDCHRQRLASDHLTHEGDCISCHMPRRQSHDSGHSAFTDHRITRRPLPAAASKPPSQLRPWRPLRGALLLRNLGIANVRQGQQQGSRSMLRRGRDQLERVTGRFRDDIGMLDALGTALVLDGSPQAGLGPLRRAIAKGPAGALNYNALAAAWWDAGAPDDAVLMLEEAIRREPTLESSYHMLAQIYVDLGRGGMARQVWQRLLEKRPGLIQARLAARRMDTAPAP